MARKRKVCAIERDMAIGAESNMNGAINELALFAGIGGGLIGTHHLLGWRCVCAVERESYRREILLRRQRDGLLPLFPIWDDVRTFDGKQWHGKVDIITAGFPCQPFTSGGSKKGKDDERNMWPETIRIIREVGPSFALLENVPGLLSFDYFGTVIGDLAEAGYDAVWTTLSAAHYKALHKRNRLWVLAYSKEKCANTNAYVQSITKKRFRTWDSETFRVVMSPDGLERQIPSFVYGMVDGISYALDRLEGCGDAQVPQVVTQAFLLLRSIIK